MLTNRRNKWTPEEDERLKMLLEADTSIHRVAVKLKRSVAAVRGRAGLLKISRRRRRPRAQGEGEMSADDPSEAYEAVRSEPGPLPPQAVDLPFLVTASELRDRKAKRRRKQDDLPGRSEAIRRLVALGLKAKK